MSEQLGSEGCNLQPCDHQAAVPSLRQRVAPTDEASASSSPRGAPARRRPCGGGTEYVEAWRAAAAAKRQSSGRCAPPAVPLPPGLPV